MLIDIVRTIIGELPYEFEFIYYIVTMGASMVLIALPLTPFLVLFSKIFGNKRR